MHRRRRPRHPAGVRRLAPDGRETPASSRARPRSSAPTTSRPAIRSGPARRPAAPAALADRGFTPNQYLTAYRLRAAASGRDHRAGRARRADRDRRLPLLGPADVRELLRPAGAADQRLRGRTQAPARAGRRDDARPRGARCGRPRAEGDRRLRVAGARLRRARGADRAASEPRPRARGDLGVARHCASRRSSISIGESGVRSAEGALALAAASGISVLASSGDDGLVGVRRPRRPLDALAVSYPASSPCVTGVGGTNVSLTAANTIQAQTVWNDAPYDVTRPAVAGSSGLFKRPSYQNGFVAASRRAVPDVSMLADVLPGLRHLLLGTGVHIAGSGEPVDRGRRHQRRARRCWPAAWRWSTNCCASTDGRTSGWPIRCSTQVGAPLRRDRRDRRRHDQRQ